MTPEQEREGLLYFIDNSAEVKRWSALPDSTEDVPLVVVEVYGAAE